jgi:mono/diheme cytochrome c family protein
MRLGWWLLIAGACAAGCEERSGIAPVEIADGDAGRGKAAIVRVGCIACHEIPGVRGRSGRVGPPLAGFAERAMIAGTVPNRADMLVTFVRNAPSLVPQTGMPPLPLDAQEARDVAAFLYTLR